MTEKHNPNEHIINMSNISLNDVDNRILENVNIWKEFPNSPVKRDTDINQNIPNQNIPNQNMPNQNMPNQNIPNQNIPNQNIPNQNIMNISHVDNTEEVNAEEGVFSFVTKIRSKATQVTNGLKGKYNEHMPETVKSKVSAIGTFVHNATDAVVDTSSSIYHRTIRPTVYNSTIGFLYTKELTKLLLEYIPENSTVLDVGIGTAYVYCANAELLKKRNIHVVGVDIDEDYFFRAKHSLIDYELEDNIELICADIYKTDLSEKKFDYVVFSDSIAVIPNVYNMLRYCEKFLKPLTGYMLITSTLFDEYNEKIDLIKRSLKYVTMVDYGTMVLKSDMEKYIKNERHSNDYEFKKIYTNALKIKKLGKTGVGSYIVRWRPGEDNY